MKSVKALLWIQLALGLVGGYVAFAYVHWSAMSIAWAYNFRAEFEKVRQLPDYHEPPPIRGESLARIVDDLESTARARADVAFYWLLTCAVFVLLATLLLWRLRRVRHREDAEQAA